MNRNDHSNSGNLGMNTKALCCSSRSDFPPSTLAVQVGPPQTCIFASLFPCFPLSLSLFLSCPLFSCPDLLSSADLSLPDAILGQPFPSANLWLGLEAQSSSVAKPAILTAAGKFSPQTHSGADLSSKGFFHLLLQAANIQSLRAAEKP